VAPIPGFVGFAVPEMQGIPDAFCPERIAECLVVLQEDVFFAYDKNDFQCFKCGNPIGMSQVRDILAGSVVIDVFIPVAIEEITEMFERNGKVIAAAETYDLVKEVWIFKGEVDCMPGTEAAAGRNDCWVRVFFLYAGEYFFDDIFFELEVAEDAFGGIEFLCIKAVLVYAVEAPDLDDACLDLAAEGFDDAPVLIVKKVSSAGWEEQYRISGMAEDQ